MKLLILGASGMLGSTLFNLFSASNDYLTIGVLRSNTDLSLFDISYRSTLRIFSDYSNLSKLYTFIESEQPDVLINCVGLVKQLKNLNSYFDDCISVNAYLPARLKVICKNLSIRLIHFSSDCVFSGNTGNYTEDMIPVANDIYGISKFLGEVSGSNCLTLRTSIIGHQLKGSYGLLEWFLSSSASVRGFSNAYFSGLTTTEVYCFLDKFALPNPSLSGLHHLSSSSISKLELLQIISSIYSHQIPIIPQSTPVIDRTLISDRLNKLTGYKSPPWYDMVSQMKRQNSFKPNV